MELLVDAGLTPMQAIQAATATGAAFLGRAGDLGTIEPGKLADLIVLTGNPLRRIPRSGRSNASWPEAPGWTWTKYRKD